MRVLYVDQNPAICSIMIDFLSKHFLVDTAHTAEQALSLMAEGTFNAVIAANNRGSGLSFLTTVSERFPLISVRMLLSGGIMTEEIHQALTKGYITRFFQNPYPILSLIKDLQFDLSITHPPGWETTQGNCHESLNCH